MKMKIIKCIKDKLDDFYCGSWKEIYRKPMRVWNKLKRSSKWFFRTWNSYDWDSEYLIIMMVYKLKDIRYQLDVVDSWFVDLRHQPTGNKMKVHIGNTDESDSENDEWIEVDETEDRLASLDKAIEIGERILKNDYIHYTDEIQNWFDTNGYLSGNNKMPKDLHDKLMEIYRKSDADEQRDREDFFNIIRDNHQYWWS